MSTQTLKRCPRCGEACSLEVSTCSGCRFEFAVISLPAVPSIPPTRPLRERSNNEEGWLGAWLNRLRRR